MPFISPEEVVFATIKDGLAAVRAAVAGADADAYLAKIYPSLTADDRAALKTWLLANGNIRVVHGYPRLDAELPVIALILDPEEQTTFYAGDVIAELDDGDGSYRAELGQRWSAAIGVVVHSEEADVTRWLYHLAKFILVRARRGLSVTFEHGQRLAGRDLAHQDMGGRLAYRRILTLRIEYDAGIVDDALADEIEETGVPDVQPDAFTFG